MFVVCYTHTIFGPFETADDAARFGKRSCFMDEWSIRPLQKTLTRSQMDELDAKYNKVAHS
jgi:hypothetical protein